MKANARHNFLIKKSRRNSTDFAILIEHEIRAC